MVESLTFVFVQQPFIETLIYIATLSAHCLVTDSRESKLSDVIKSLNQNPLNLGHKDLSTYQDHKHRRFSNNNDFTFDACV